MNNAEWCLVNGIKFAGISVGIIPRKKGNFYKVLGNANGLGNREPIGMMPREQTGDMTEGESLRAFKQWLDLEHEDYKEPEDILTGEERGYLKNFLKPFRTGCIEYIRKCGYDYTYVNSLVIYSTDYGNFLIPTGNYEYAGMEENKNYTLEELGI